MTDRIGERIVQAAFPPHRVFRDGAARLPIRQPIRTARPSARDIRITSERGVPPIRSAAAASQPEEGPAELFFAQPAAGTESAGVSEKPVREKEQRADPERLPAWAQELLEKAGVSDTARQTAVFHGKSGNSAQQIRWSRPGTEAFPKSAAPSGPAELSFKERGEEKERVGQRPISDAELQRTADKVYRIISERLRRELRRSGR